MKRDKIRKIVLKETLLLSLFGYNKLLHVANTISFFGIRCEELLPSVNELIVCGPGSCADETEEDH